MKKVAVILAVFILFQTNLFSAIYTVGQGKTYSNISAVPVLSPGDVIEVYAGSYNEYKLFTVNGSKDKPITIKGVGAEKPVIDGTGLDVSGVGKIPRALFQIDGDNYMIENLEFKNADNTNGHNGAGLRIMGANVTVRGCKISKCENGIMSSGRASVLVEGCEIFECGSRHEIGYSHNMYMGGVSFTLKESYIHDSICAQNVKSRAHYNELLYNYIADANSGEVDLVEAKETAAPNSNAVLIGNIIMKRSAPSKSGIAGNNSKFITFGKDGKGERNGTIYLINNTIISGMEKNKPVWLSSKTKAELYNNIFYGSATVLADNFSKENSSGSNNWFSAGIGLPAGLKENIRGKDPGFVNPEKRDFHLKSNSICINAGVITPQYLDGSGSVHSGVAAVQYVQHLKTVLRKSSGKPALGALE